MLSSNEYQTDYIGLDGHLHNTFTNEAAFPLKCCQAEVFSQVQQYLPRSLIAEYHAKAAEFADKVNRTYCHDADCAAWIPAKNFSGDWGRCNKCGEKTCKLCKGGDHGIDCPKDEALAKVLEEGDRKGWKRCKYCRAMLELKDGCKSSPVTLSRFVMPSMSMTTQRSNGS